MHKFPLIILGLFFVFIILFPREVLASPPTYNLTETPSPKQYNSMWSGFSYLGWFSPQLVDVNDNGKADLIFSGAQTTSVWGIYIVYDDILERDGFGNSLSYLTDYTLFIKGDVTAYSYLGLPMRVIDVTNDGLVDIVATSNYTDFNSRTNSGSVFVIPHEVFSNISTKTDLDITTDNVWTTRLDGAAAGHNFGYHIDIGDYNGDGKNDLSACSAEADYNSRTDSGSCYLLENSLISQTATYGSVTKDVSSSDNYSFRIDGPASTSNLYGISNVMFADLDNDGSNDLTVSNNWAAYPGRTTPGSVWILRNDQITSSNPDKTIDLATTNNYSIRYLGDDNTYLSLADWNGTIADLDGDGLDDLLLHSGVTDAHYISGTLFNTLLSGNGQDIDLRDPDNYTAIVTSSLGSNINLTDVVQDFNNDGVVDVFIFDDNTDYSGTNYGSTYVVDGNAFRGLPEHGSTIDITADASHFARYDGGATETTSVQVFQGDVNADDIFDYVFLSTSAKKLWLVFNFPHTITGNSISTSTAKSVPVTITGSVSASNSVSTIAGVQYSIDDNSPSAGSWTACAATDGSFNSTSENYTCSLNQSLEGHTIYIRAYDVNTVYTAPSRYYAQAFLAAAPAAAQPQIYQSTSPNLTGTFAPVGDSNTANQKVLAIIQSNTFSFDAFLSSIVALPSSAGILPNPLTGAISTGPPGNTVVAGSNVLGVTTSSCTWWQVGKIQNIWYKAYAPGYQIDNSAKIIPQLQNYPSILVLSYTTQNLASLGSAYDPFNPTSLKLAYSSDGIHWKILSGSVVDTVNKTVAAIQKIGGYYMIIGPVCFTGALEETETEEETGDLQEEKQSEEGKPDQETTGFTPVPSPAFINPIPWLTLGIISLLGFLFFFIKRRRKKIPKLN